MPSFSFDGLTELYDQTRTFDPACFAAALDWVTVRFPPTLFRSLLEPGVGTGRIARPLAASGYQVTGIDISEEMLGACAAQNQRFGETRDFSYLLADTTNLPFPAQSFDLCLAIHLFYFVLDWQKAIREILRVLRPGGAIVLLHTGFGTEVPYLNERYRILAEAKGYIFPVYGVRSTTEVIEYAVSLGCRIERVEESSWKWTARISLRDALAYLRAQAYSFTKEVPKELHQAVVTELQRESLEQYHNLETILEVPNRISIIIVSPPDK